MSPRNLFNRFQAWASGGNNPPKATDDAPNTSDPVSPAPTVIFHDVATDLISDGLKKQAEYEQQRLTVDKKLAEYETLDRLKKQAEYEQQPLTLDRLKEQAEDKQKFEIWLNEQRGPVSPWFQKQNEERKQRAEDERKRAEEERNQTEGDEQKHVYDDRKRLERFEEERKKNIERFQEERKQRAEEERKRAEEERKQRAEEERKRAETEAPYRILLTKHRDIADKFLEIADRKVSVLDEYGDENWDALPQEIHQCLTKIAMREQSIDVSKISQKPQLYAEFEKLAGAYNDPTARYLAAMLDSEFRTYHKVRKRLPNAAQDFRTLKNIEFETYVRRRLEGAGYAVVGTRATGDQGADFIAKRNGRTIAIQAKGYTGTVGNSAVQEIVGALRLYNADEGWVVTNSTFTRSARELAHANKIRLIDGHGLKDSLP